MLRRRSSALVWLASLLLAACGGGGGDDGGGTQPPPADTTAPVVSISAPAANANVVGVVSVTATATDNVGVVGVQFQLEGTALGAEDTVAPYLFDWDTTTATIGAHALRAVARDAAGNQTTSVTVNVMVLDTTPPVVAISAPAANGSVSGVVSVTADAADNVAVVGVQFQLDGIALGPEDATAPYSLDWNTMGAVNGGHTLRAIARDAAGNQTIANAIDVTVTNVVVPDSTPPAVAVTAPAANATVSGVVSIAATATDNVGVAGVQFQLDGAAFGPEDTAAPYSFDWNTASATNGAHTLRAIARDLAGNQAISTVVNVTVSNAGPDTMAPVVAITAPSANATVSGVVSVTATATDNVGVAGVQFQLDGAALGAEDTTAPYSINWNTTGATDGGHSLRAVARDAAGNQTTSTTINVTVGNTPPDTSPPTVALTAPANGATVSGTVTVSANASDAVGVVGVQFRLDGAALQTEDLTAPYTISWDTTTATNAGHALTAVARDAAGNSTTSATVNVTVDNTPPPPGAAIVAGQIELDRPTIENLGVALPIGTSDNNHNATVTVQYRKTGDATWLDALPLLRVRPELLSEEDPTDFTVDRQFAGSIFNLLPDTEYEISLDIQDPDGGSTTRTTTARTRPVPVADPATVRTVNVSTLAALNTALGAALPGDVIMIANGTYNGSISISRSGTALNPIFIRGASRDGVIINATGATAGVSVNGSYVTVEDLTIQNSSWGVHLDTNGNVTSNVVVRRLKITNVSFGIQARFGDKRDYYICDNLIQGKVAWPDTDNTVWDFEGIVVTGSGHVVCHNTLSGFGDALGMSFRADVPNRAIDFYGNDVLWTGDNGIELDFGERNVRAYRNRFTNGGNHSISFQPTYGGPVYAMRNVVYHSKFGPFKFNNEPTGMILLHNTAVRGETGWDQPGVRADNFIMYNNIIIGATQALSMTLTADPVIIDYNGWRPDGTFSVGNQSWPNFANMQANSPYEHNGRLLTSLPFAAPITLPAEDNTFVSPPDFALSAGSNAIDGGLRLPNINDDFVGANPDLGAIELGATPVQYGVR